MELYKTMKFFTIGDFNAKLEQKDIQMIALGNFGIYTQIDRGDMLVGFAERNNIMIISTFFDHNTSKKWT